MILKKLRRRLGIFGERQKFSEGARKFLKLQQTSAFFKDRGPRWCFELKTPVTVSENRRFFVQLRGVFRAIGPFEMVDFREVFGHNVHHAWGHAWPQTWGHTWPQTWGPKIPPAMDGGCCVFSESSFGFDVNVD